MSNADERGKLQRRELPLLITKEYCQGKTFIVTGANVGLGLEAARHLVSLGPSRVVMAVRNVASGEKAKADVEASTGISGVAQVWQLDLSSYDSVKAFASKAVSELERIDALINNAGVANGEPIKAEGHLINCTVNVLSTFLLSILLMPKMKQDAIKFNTTPHITTVTSGTALDMKPLWDKIKDDPINGMDEGKVPTMPTYPLSKLMEVMIVRHLAKLIPISTGRVAFNTVCPGICKTDLSRSAPTEFKTHLAQLHETIGRTADHGSRNLLFGAVAGAENHGGFVDSCEMRNDLIPEFITGSEGQEDAKRLWDSVAVELEKTAPGCVAKAMA